MFAGTGSGSSWVFLASSSAPCALPGAPILLQAACRFSLERCFNAHAHADAREKRGGRGNSYRQHGNACAESPLDATRRERCVWSGAAGDAQQDAGRAVGAVVHDDIASLRLDDEARGDR
jgi:hypothetical protein